MLNRSFGCDMRPRSRGSGARERPRAEVVARYSQLLRDASAGELAILLLSKELTPATARLQVCRRGILVASAYAAVAMPSGLR